jgi:long-subunit fatty acid transport protein
VTVPNGLQAAFIAPYIQAGGIEAPWGNGTVLGAGAIFRIADNIDLDVSYLAAKYKNATVDNENIIKIAISRKF